MSYYASADGNIKLKNRLSEKVSMSFWIFY